MMEAIELEKLVIESMLADRELKPVKSTVNLDAVVVVGREFTGVGFLVEYERSDELRVFGTGVKLRWGKVGARLNAAKIETGYLVYVDDGYVTAVEGYTYGDKWPDQVKDIELYELKPGAALLTPPHDD